MRRQEKETSQSHLHATATERSWQVNYLCMFLEVAVNNIDNFFSGPPSLELHGW